MARSIRHTYDLRPETFELSEMHAIQTELSVWEDYSIKTKTIKLPCFLIDIVKRVKL